MARWAAAVSEGPPDGLSSAIGLDASHQHTVAVAAAWRLAGGGCHVELVDVEVSDPLAAMELVVEHAARKRTPVVVDAASPAASMIPFLKTQRCKVIVTSAPEMARACGGFVDDVEAARLTHGNQPLLNAAVAGARKRPIGVAGAYGWDRADGSVFVAPLVAATLARFGAVSAARSGHAVFV